MEANRPQTPEISAKMVNSKHSSRHSSNVLDEYDIIHDDAVKTNASGGKSTTGLTEPPEVPPRQKDPLQTHSQISSRNRLSSSEKSSTDVDSHTNISRCPNINSKEKIIFCVDISQEIEAPRFRSRVGEKKDAKSLIRSGLNIFMQSKLRLDKKHEFALVLLHEKATLVRDFTNVPRDILLGFDDVQQMRVCEMCDIEDLFDFVQKFSPPPPVEDDIERTIPEFTVRVILLYTRSNCPLMFDSKQSFNELNSSPYFFIDALYLHEPVSEENKCQEVFDSICDLDQKGLSYIFGASRNLTKVYDTMGQMLAHPLQRPVQSETMYRIGSSLPVPENG
ncbi:BRISC and BRCA1-A complex member 1-like [Mya arenaria]|uniref:BRISC and BRCA1-A complex member 1-like n=1 Tax=Mya arenaria TaxID=6604 RepID=UPI0022E69BBE|nr:BRISC and BRCA1-A complex member 1-like [Mya arenaria]